MARLREFDEVKALSAIEQVFWAQGFEGTSYADLTSASGLGKGSLYAAFGNKEALYVRSLLSYIEREIGLGVCLLSGNSEFEPLSGKERIHMFLGVAIDAVENRQDRRGCFVCNAAIDLAPFNPDVEEVVKSALARVIEGLQIALNLDGSNASSEHLLATYLGMRVMAKGGASADDLHAIRTAAINAI